MNYIEVQKYLFSINGLIARPNLSERQKWKILVLKQDGPVVSPAFLPFINQSSFRQQLNGNELIIMFSQQLFKSSIYRSRIRANHK